VGIEHEFIRGSITDKSCITEFFSNLDFVFHLAARGSVPKSFQNQVATYEVNTVGSINVIEEARVSSIPLVLISSSSVYGLGTKGPKTENHPKSPISPYAVSKLAMELAANVNRITLGQKVMTIRLFNVFGPKQKGDHDYAAVIPRWINAAMNSKTVVLHGNGEQSRDFTYVEDLVSILAEIIERPDIFDYPELNLAFGQPISLNDLLKIIEKELGAFEIRHEPMRAGDIFQSSNDTSLLRRIFPNFQPTSIEQAIKETLTWYRNVGKK
jgi:UDP-glucose 4-epimerase